MILTNDLAIEASIASAAKKLKAFDSAAPACVEPGTVFSVLFAMLLA